MLVRRFGQPYDVAWNTTVCELMALIKFDEDTKPTSRKSDGKPAAKTTTASGLDRHWLKTLKDKAHGRSG